LVVLQGHPQGEIEWEFPCLPQPRENIRVDLIVTPDEAIWCAEPHRPPGILWEHLDPDKIAEIPALAALAARH
jgi:5-formyltetrahydrofolate cyclo-ligase